MKSRMRSASKPQEANSLRWAERQEVRAWSSMSSTPRKAEAEAARLSSPSSSFRASQRGERRPAQWGARRGSKAAMAVSIRLG